MKNIFSKSRRKSIFLYGLKEELRLIADLIYRSERVPYAEPVPTNEALSGKPQGIKNWEDAEQLTKALSSSPSFDTVPKEFVCYDGLRTLGCGLQNLLSLQEWIDFVAHRLRRQGVDLITYRSTWRSPEKHLAIFRREVSDSGRTIRFRKNRSGREIITNLPAKVIHRGKLVNRDLTSKYVNTVNGIRKTTPGLEKDWTRTFHFFGASEAYGAHLKDDETVPSFFSSLVHEICERVLNHGMGGVNFIDVVGRLLSSNFQRGDVVFLTMPFTGEQLEDHEFILDDDCFFDSYHLNAIGAGKAANLLFENLEERRLVREFDLEALAKAEDIISIYKRAICEIEAAEFEGSDVEAYLTYLDAKVPGLIERQGNRIYGSVAVNCNPITKGHLTLIEYAAKSVDHLFVLVIEEDKSTVSFEDRFNMVRDVCAEFENITTLRGGKFVCTEYIALEYFVKGEEQPENIDFSLESFYFGTFIAPKLGVTKIFLGDEPSCDVTRQYNDHMDATMPTYGIDLTIIPRKADSDGVPISASSVRKLIQENNWEAVEDMVPPLAYSYMRSQPILRQT
jgi:hypothetical protein